MAPSVFCRILPVAMKQKVAIQPQSANAKKMEKNRGSPKPGEKN